ncbi:MAG: S8 family serine peptidase, partial [Bacteroidota bacterium]
LQIPKSGAASLLRDFSWQGLFRQQNVNLKATLMTVEKGANRSVALVHLSLPPGLDVFTAMQQLEGQEGILWSSPNFYFPGDPREIVPNDPSYASQNHHPLMKNDLAWDITFGSAAVKIGVTDDGVELAHTDLAANIWVNPGEIAGNNMDDDMNGYVDDVNGWDFVANNNNPNPAVPSDDHGTHVSGIAAGRTNNGVGIAGTAGGCTIMPLQFYNPAQPWTAAIVNASFTYAADNGAKIVNTSYNIDGFVGDPVFTAGLQYLHDAGVLHFNSGGNSNQLNPPRQAFTQTLLVVSTTSTDVKSSFSNYGTGMDISAPGSAILSTLTGNTYGTQSGTSMATPNAAGAAALIWSANPTWNSYQVAAKLLATADNINAQNPTILGLFGSGRVNSYAALTATLPAPKVSSLTGLPAEGVTAPAAGISSFSVAFNQVMNPASVNNPANFELRYAGLNGNFGDGDDVLYPVTTAEPYRLGTNQLTCQISNLPFACGLYRFSLISGGLENPFGTDLDGDGNGTGGDNFVRNFTLTDPLYYLDGDGDGYGTGAQLMACPLPANAVLLNGDCNDANPNVNPGETEVCNGVDDDCNSVVDFPTVTYASTNVPVAISESGTSTVTSTLTISGATGNITDLNVKNLHIYHTWTGDLKATLTSPGNVNFVLFDQPDDGDCGENHLLATFDDAAVNTAANFENTCNASGLPTPPPYAINGTYQPINSLAALNGTSPNGTWTLTVQDFFDGDGGSIQGWGLEITVPLTSAPYYVDADGDTYGNPASSVQLACTPAPGSGLVSDHTDCNDADAGIHPNAPETCDACDEDCDGMADDNAPSEACGLPSPPNCAGTMNCLPQSVTPGGCAASPMYSSCNNNPLPETCDDIDNDCDGTADDNIPSVPCIPAGTPSGLVYGGTSQCQMGTTQCVNDSTVCVGFVGPSAEVCDGIDNDCDGMIDDGIPSVSCVPVGTPPGLVYGGTSQCQQGTTQCVNGSTVCVGFVGPSAEVCDNIDNDCDGTVDEGVSSEINVSVSPASRAEDGTDNLVFTFQRDCPVHPITVNFDVSGTATFSMDYGQMGAATFNATSGTVTFLAGVSSATVTIDPALDNTVELDETVILTLATGMGYTAGATNFATGTIDNDDQAQVDITANVSQPEATSPQQFSVTLSNPVDVQVSVNFATANGSATTGDNDFNAENQTVTFSAGTTTSQQVNVTVNNDNQVEADENFGVSIGSLSASGRDVSLGNTSRTGTILNDEIDFGDASDTYATLLSSNGARHNASLALCLGATI